MGNGRGRRPAGLAWIFGALAIAGPHGAYAQDAAADPQTQNAAPVLYVGPADAPPVAIDPAVARDDAGAAEPGPALYVESDRPPISAADDPDAAGDAVRSLPRIWRDRGIGVAVAPVGDRARAVDCMAMAIAYEAGREPLAGQQAVAQVILNRLRVPRFPKSVCGVVFDGSSRSTGCQFTFTCDGSIRRQLRDDTLLSARHIAEAVLAGGVPDRVGGATHYHADYVLPYWASTGTRVTKIGAHIFYRMPGDAALLGQPMVLTGPEPEIAALQGTHGARRWPALARAAPAAGGAMFAPWGLPVATVAQR